MPNASGNARDFDPPARFPAGGSVFDYLCACRPRQGAQPLELRIIKSTLHTARVPLELEEDVAQAIRMAWIMSIARVDKFEPEQVLQYAYTIAEQAALRERREIQHVARVPGNGMRLRADGTRYAPAAILAPGYSWEDIERYHRADDGQQEDQVVSQAHREELPTDQDTLLVEPGESALEQRRAQIVEEYSRRLTTVQFEILRQLLTGMSLKEIHAYKHISYVRLLKELWISSSVLGVDISKIELLKK